MFAKRQQVRVTGGFTGSTFPVARTGIVVWVGPKNVKVWVSALDREFTFNRETGASATRGVTASIEALP